MTIMDADLDTDIIMALDFEYAPPCEAVHGCHLDEVATWKVIWSCCGGINLYCDTHKENLLIVLELYKDTNLEHAPEKGGCGGTLGVMVLEKI